MMSAALGWITGGSATRLTATLLVGAALGATGAWQLSAAARHRMAADHLREAARAIDVARSETARYQRTADEAEQRATERTQTAQRAAASARAELDRLRQQLAATGPDAASCPATAERAATLAAVQRECAGALVELGRAADAHATDAVRLWEAWPRPPD